MQRTALTDEQVALALQQGEFGLPVNGPVLQFNGMKMLAMKLETFQKEREKKDAKLAQQLHQQLNHHIGGVVASGLGGVVASGHGGVVASGHGGVVASGRVGIGRADAMTDTEFHKWLESGSGSYESRTYAARLKVLEGMPL